MYLKRGDYVQVIAGVNIGQRGKVLKVLPAKNKVVVESVNYIYKHLKRSQQHPQGGRIQKESPIHASNVMLYCQKCQSPRRVGYKIVLPETTDQKQGRKIARHKVRVCRKCGDQI